MCTRIVVLRDGHVAAELGGDGLTEHALVSAMEGDERDPDVSPRARHRAGRARARPRRAQARPAARAPRASASRAASPSTASARSTCGWGSSCCSRSGCPDTFPNVATAKQILNANAITALAALSITSRWRRGLRPVVRVHHDAQRRRRRHFVADGVPLVPAVALALSCRPGHRRDQRDRRRVMRIDSFIATLATGSLIQR